MTVRVAVIPARGGSVRIPRKNVRAFHGKPIIAYSIETARQTRLFDRVIVSTDDGEIADVAAEYGAEVLRRQQCDGTTGTQEVVRQVLFQRGELQAADFVCCIYATAPLMRVRDLKWGSCEMARGVANFAFSVGTDPLRDAGQFYWGRTEAFLAGCPLIDPKTAMIPIPEDRVCDINTIEDFSRAEAMYNALLNARAA